MLFKIITFFLIGMAVLAMFGKLRIPKIKAYEKRKCAKCGSFRIGKSSCMCERPKT
ncbi:hypothetical protein [uncultured Litoreibacter sp.]|uniref:hypothetical protein n=1 Tax=uncultured Litoreibacter sp. TaxID=1392394 RepID=UPI0026108C63|nr:hypothetical protein [uncultured Litoreibacter sp.]